MSLEELPLWLGDGSDPPAFPPLEYALKEPNGLVGIGGSLSTDWLLAAYARGIFPWYSPGEPILWWSPDPRMVLFPEHLKVRRSLAKRIRNGGFRVSLNEDFPATIRACASGHDDGTWITSDMMRAYEELHHAGFAHSVEVRQEGKLVGGLYGVAVGTTFFGESMFSLVNDSSKVALALLVDELKRRHFSMVDCQMHTHHLQSLGAELIPRQDFVARIQAGLAGPAAPGAFKPGPHAPGTPADAGTAPAWRGILLEPH